MIKYSVTPPRCGWSKLAFPSQLTFLTNRTDLKPQTPEKRTAGKRQKIRAREMVWAVGMGTGVQVVSLTQGGDVPPPKGLYELGSHLMVDSLRLWAAAGEGRT